MNAEKNIPDIHHPDHVPPGLTDAEVQTRRAKFGSNGLTSSERFSVLKQLGRAFGNPLLWIVIGAAIISFFVGQKTNAIILVFMVLLSVTLDYINTSRSESAIKLLATRVVTKASVMRNGQRVELPLADLVPDDVVLLSAGDVLPADGLLLSSRDFFVNQSALTGESLPVEKMVGQPTTPLSPNDAHAVFLGTSAISGYAVMKITATAKHTAYGAIVARLETQDDLTDFDKGLRQFSVFLMRLTIAMVVLVFVLNMLAHRGLFEAFLFSIAIAIGMTPELLPVIMTVSLSRGAMRMSKKHVIVKRLPAIQNVGRMDILCTDKTGTLTENRIAVVEYVDVDGKPQDDVLRAGFLSSSFHSGVMNPIDQAIVNYKAFDLQTTEKIDELPFDFERRRESVIIGEQGKHWLITKGAPEAMFTICSHMQLAGATLPADTVLLKQRYDTLSMSGFRVLAVARREIADQQEAYTPSEEHDMTFLGFVALLDPPKLGVKQTIDELEDLGIEVKILTGDGLNLTKKICTDIDCPVKGAITGDDLEKMNDVDWREAVKNNTIFARINPEQKERIIATLKMTGHVVGFLGDGINDAPALKKADVGISVDNAVDVARETADIILLEPSLEAIRDGVVEGRRTFHNTIKYIKMALSSNFGNMFSMTAASAFLPFLPMLPTQVLLNNFFYDSSQLGLSTDNVDDQDLRKPIGWDFAFIRKFMMVFGPISSVFDILTFWILIHFIHASAAVFQTSWFMESIATQVLVIYVIRTTRIPFLQSRPSLILLLNTGVIVLLAWILPFIGLGHPFGFVAISRTLVLSLVGVVLTYLVMVALAQRVMFKTRQHLMT